MTEVLKVEALSKRYKNKRVLSNLDIFMQKGEVIGLLGENGAGKSTAIECILGIQKYDSGNIRIFNLDPLTDRKQISQKIGVQFQNVHYQDKIKVDEICRITACLYNKPMNWIDLLGKFDLSDLQSSYVSNLSGGEYQRLSIVLALIPNPDLVFFDELTTALDMRARKNVMEYIKKLKISGLSIVLVSHFMDEVEQLCDRIYILKKGETVISGSIPYVINQSGKANLEEAYLYFSGSEEI